MSKPIAFLLGICALWSTAALASQAQGDWRAIVTEFDRDRLARFEKALAQGLDELRPANVSSEDRAALRSVLDARPRAITARRVLGPWACRTIKVGGPFAGLIVYDWFDCRVVRKEGRLFFEKLSGSQRVSGFLYERNDTDLVLLGAPSVNDEPQRTYSGSKGGIEDPQKQDKVGIFQPLADGRARVLFPYPVLESTFDVLELRRP